MYGPSDHPDGPTPGALQVDDYPLEYYAEMLRLQIELRMLFLIDFWAARWSPVIS
jgi:hypothetical protein